MVLLKRVHGRWPSAPHFSGDGSNWPPPASRVRFPGPSLGGRYDEMRVEIFEDRETMGAARWGASCAGRNLWGAFYLYVCKGVLMKEILGLVAYPIVFLVGFFLSAAFAIEDIKRLKAEIKRLQGGKA